ncbi:energy transducer TonB [Myxococcus sp. AM011]|uniref:AgmX/PglI C-terminal domain-containing protein n=1 Tax=Myxococcus sp. AM011 TaxID=2745200 RepID=UPI00159619B6|nr:AgmX/PglI C-terminal domain-containing protein [Myxococcus sp. AM011]NVJ22784.1 energy transducer TonB [Myxococcus sp. AM011]
MNVGDPEGPLDKDSIRRTIHLNRGQIVTCYRHHQVDLPATGGKVVIRFVIATNGTVSEAKVATTTTLHDPALEACIVDSMMTWRFPKPTETPQVVVTYPYIFKPESPTKQ